MSDYRRSRQGATFFFTLVTHQRRSILTSTLGRRCLRSAFHTARISRPFKIVALVLLPDHLHTIWELPLNDSDYSTRWRHIKSEFSKQWLAEGGNEGDISPSRSQRGERAIWQRRFYEHTCRDDADGKRCADYIHINPVKHGLVAQVSEWPWSSFHQFVQLGEYPSDWGTHVPSFATEFQEFE